MNRALAFLAIAAMGNVTYHLGQKTISPSANPMALLMGVYAIAFVLCGLLAPLFPGRIELAPLLSWPVLVLGAGVVLIEIGFLLAYRSGNMLQWSGVAVNGAATLLLIPIALVVFREPFSPVRIAGIGLTLAGLALLAR
ncbi:MAG TPA: EamA family transporter [Myxococcales bacterium]|nr:EamA family transporter [Myxococcales bacterium]